MRCVSTQQKKNYVLPNLLESSARSKNKMQITIVMGVGCKNSLKINKRFALLRAESV